MKISRLVNLTGLLLVNAYSLQNTQFQIDIDDITGAVTSLRDAQGNSSIDWISSHSNAPWQPLGSRWGLGFADLGAAYLHRFYWTEPDLKTGQDGSYKAIYNAGPLDITVRRTLDSNSSTFTERYTFRNNGDEALDLATRSKAALAIYTPFNDHYTNTSDSLNHRSFAHVWANGGSNAWVKLEQMGGHGRNLGLVLTEGSLVGYSIESRDIITLSNTRGVFQLHPALPVLQPGESSSVEWALFWHSDWDDFFKQSQQLSKQFVRFEISQHTLVLGEKAEIRLTGGVSSTSLINGSPVSCDSPDECTYNYTAKTLGRQALQVTTQLMDSTTANSTAYVNVVPPVDDIISSRVNFIIQKQQVNDGTDNPNTGAYAVYDNQAQSIAFWDKGTDRTTGRERLGMGITIARFLLLHPNNTEVRSSFEKYYEFVTLKLQSENGDVYDRPVGSGTSRKRLYNWPWVLQFHIAAARLPFEITSAGKTPVEWFMLSLESFYREGGKDLYAIGLPILESLRFFKQRNNTARYDRARELFVRHGEVILGRGLDYPPFEVNFEQSIVAPAAIIMLELNRVTGNETWLEAGELQLTTLLRFQGRQPDHLVHRVGIRHWDGYWFGKDRHWGDTFPHHWSTLDAVALHHYGQIIGDDQHLDHVQEILRNNLALFSPDGTAGCAWIYPLTVNGRETHYRDPYANDQDWILNHILYIDDDNRQSSF
ncbi:unnamed protein product [Clonostachys solani]|uniref:Six-hairpin glycosidase n=1 Tax=Clonostachys solani TaxID=160281 RepID=A0A9N9YZF3_9HYPO|nr:unnamed protein product [Clonostachys solani]